MSKPVIGIVGIGFVGDTMRRWYKDKGYHVVTFDRYKPSDRKITFHEADIIFVCVPTPFKDGACDISAIESTMKWLPDNKVVLLRSTQPPGTTDALQKKYPKKTLIHYPEFLTTHTADYDFANPERTVLGITNVDRADLHWVMEHLPEAKKTIVIGAKEAETVKYMGNTFFTTKNVFVNMWYDYCAKNHIDWDEVVTAFAQDPRIGEEHTRIFDKGGRGAGGVCLPKDTAAAIEFFKSVNADLLKVVKKRNDYRLKKSNKTEFNKMYEL